MSPQDTPTRRQLIASAAGAAGAVLLAGGAGNVLSGGRVAALGGPVGDAVTGPASALEQAEAVGIRGLLDFPVDATGGGLVMPNGYREGTHKGIDLGNECTDGRGRALLACADAEVNSIRQLSRAGKLITLRDGENTYYRYHHLDEYAGLEVGDPVTRGQIVGYMGATGNTSWPHLHFEVWRLSLNPAIGFPVDPLPLLSIPRGVNVGPPNCSD